MIPRSTVVCLGLAQLISWGTSYYLIGGFGEAIAADLGLSRGLAYGGFSLALLVMGLSSPLIGGLIDRHGGRMVMNAGALLSATGCVLLALSHGVVLYFTAWICLGLAMRLTLYDAAFAALARLGGIAARRAMSQITLPGGLASTVFWPLGHVIAEHAGWRGAVLAYAGFALLTIPLHLSLPSGRHEAQATSAAPPPRPLARTGRQRALAGALYAAIVMGTNVLNAAMSAHMIAILAGLGVAAATAVWVATLRGIGQSSARLLEVLFGGRLHPLALNLLACATLPFAFVAGLFSGEAGAAALAFAFVYGAANGIVTITRGTLPLMLFDPRSYGALVGRLLVPGFIVSAAAPLAYAAVIGRFGEAGALVLSFITAALVAVAAAWLAVAFRPQRADRDR
ncbi:MFS transporter [Bradyrhizobium sp. 2TAF24]|uniref:MFS transporter n=1 Tax=Bradyrhizobium sp. 2TAF24 TaxID=3233011 RepID=UPI003F92BE31